MKILYLTNIPSPYRVDFFNELGKKCNLTVLYERSNAKDRNETWLNKRAITFKEIFLKGIKFGNDTALCLGVLKFLKPRLYDFIIVGGYSTPTGILAIMYLRLKGIPFILSSDGGFIKNDNKILYYAKKLLISKASAWLSTGKMTDIYLNFYGANQNKIFRYYLSSIKNEDILQFPITREEKLKIRYNLNMAENKIIISVGQFIYRKGFDVLIEACKKIDKDIGIYIIGGEPSNQYIALKNRLNLYNVHFIGFKSKKELSEYYKAADLFVLPTREDIWGLVINEAMSYGLPIITTDKCIAGLELIEDGINGYIVTVNNSDILAEKISYILSNPVLLNKMSTKNIQKIKSYTVEKMALQHFEILRNMQEK